MAKAEEINESQLSDDIFELDFDEESVEYYIVDENDNEIGVCLNENGQLVEYLYEEDAPAQSQNTNSGAVTKQVNEAAQSIKNMRDELGTASEDAKQVAQELKDTAEELQGMLNEVKDSFKIFPSKKKK